MTTSLPQGVDDLLKKFERRISTLEQAILLISKRTNVDISKVLQDNSDKKGPSKSAGNKKKSSLNFGPRHLQPSPRPTPHVVFSAKKLWINVRSLSDHPKTVRLKPPSSRLTIISSGLPGQHIKQWAEPNTTAISIPLTLSSSSLTLSQQPEPVELEVEEDLQSEGEEGHHNEDDGDEEYFPSDAELEDEEHENPLKLSVKDVSEEETKEHPQELHRPQRGRKRKNPSSPQKPKDYKCDKCFLGGFPTLKTLNLHKISEHGLRSKMPNGQGWRSCPHCDYKVYGNTKYQNHLRVHSGERPYLCSQCGFASKNKEALNVHTLRVHGQGFPTLVCKYCGKEVKGNDALKTHERLHEGYGKMCTICNRKFVHLKDHIQTVHERIRKYECHLCEFKFLKKCNLDRHVKSHDNPNRRIKSYHIVRPERLLNRGKKTVLRIFEEEQNQTPNVKEKEVETNVRQEMLGANENDGNEVLEMIVLENCEETLNLEEKN
ncbi:putative zinc finger protein [Orchesella cincta]|uniref:Putative zinc finger protein n=1 Tax=Orchesella cincta TaxID=48709 RepID=A0A1D2MCX9_ORCCI|nr:putative zinc finger protein [Orchesella cincta]